jgi:hypothetical protein
MKRYLRWTYWHCSRWEGKRRRKKRRKKKKRLWSTVE